MRLPPTTDPCDGFVVWVGLDAVRVTRRASAGWPVESTAPGVAGEVARALGSPLFLRSRAYDGPGGEPLFRWHLESAQVIVVFDRRIDRERFEGALRGVDVADVVRIGGIDAEGHARCALVATHAPDDLSAQAENQTFEGRVEPDGTLVVARPGLPEARLGMAPEALPGEPETGLHMVAIALRTDASPAAHLDAAARARWADRRYGYFALARE